MLADLTVSLLALYAAERLAQLLRVDLDDPKAARGGIFALQIHSGGPMEVRFKEIRLELLSGK